MYNDCTRICIESIFFEIIVESIKRLSFYWHDSWRSNFNTLITIKSLLLDGRAHHVFEKATSSGPSLIRNLGTHFPFACSLDWSKIVHSTSDIFLLNLGKCLDNHLCLRNKSLKFYFEIVSLIIYVGATLVVVLFLDNEGWKYTLELC